MPVIPLGVKPYTIRPPCTMGDMGTPSSSLLKDIQRVLHMIDDERHLTAHTLYGTIQARIQQFDKENNQQYINTNNSNHSNHNNNSTTTSTNQQSKLKSKGSFLFPKRGNNNNDKSQINDPVTIEEERNMMQQVKDILVKKKDVFEKLEV
jgi:hypothetical protein